MSLNLHDILKARGKTWCILMLFETMFWNLELMRKCWNHGRQMVHY